MLTLRPITSDDIAVIRGWPPYQPEFRDLDYALREGGWIDEYREKAGTDILVADDDGEISGFSIIAREASGSAEFRIALHPERLGQGTGKIVTRLSLAHGFSDTATTTIRLIVRKNNPRAERLYKDLHFRHTGECTEKIQGQMVEFRRMEIDRDTFLGVKL
jgi:RimJ/RimL family protein N-acetyltransferase